METLIENIIKDLYSRLTAEEFKKVQNALLEIAENSGNSRAAIAAAIYKTLFKISEREK